MQTSMKGVAALAAHEGLVPAPYRDSVNVLTVYIGHTAAAGSPDPASMPMAMPGDLDAAIVQAFEVFRADLAKYEAAVSKAITVPIEQHEFDAAVSFHYNTGAIRRASWVKSLNAGDRVAAASKIMNWTKPPEITERRRAEQTLFADGIYPDDHVVVWKTDGRGNVIWKPARTLSPADVAALMQPAEVEPTPEPDRPSFMGLFLSMFSKG